jgi:hypothetical protein
VLTSPDPARENAKAARCPLRASPPRVSPPAGSRHSRARTWSVTNRGLSRARSCSALSALDILRCAPIQTAASWARGPRRQQRFSFRVTAATMRRPNRRLLRAPSRSQPTLAPGQRTCSRCDKSRPPALRERKSPGAAADKPPFVFRVPSGAAPPSPGLRADSKARAGALALAARDKHARSDEQIDRRRAFAAPFRTAQASSGLAIAVGQERYRGGPR